MTTRRFLSLLILSIHLISTAQEKTDVSLNYKKNPANQLQRVESKRGNLFHKLGHHGPAIENPWFGLRLYFNKKTAIDLYSKETPQLELKEKHWYPSKQDQLNGWGADYYKVGKTLGLGGIKLWDGQDIVDLHPVSKRSAEVMNYNDSAAMEMVSEGVKYKDEIVDISVRVTLYADSREATVTAESLHGEKVQFVSGICVYDELEIKKTDRYIATWGIHPEDVAAEKVAVGAVLFIPQEETRAVVRVKDQYIVISQPVSTFTLKISAANVREAGIDSFSAFIKEIENLLITP